MNTIYLIIIFLIIVYYKFCDYLPKKKESFVEYKKNKKYISIKHGNRQFVHPEYLIDPYIRHSKRINNMILKEWRYMKPDEKDKIKKIFYKSFNKDFNLSKDTLILSYVIDKKIVGFVGLLTTKQLEKYLADNNISDSNIYGIIDQHGLYMYNLCVLPKYRKMGIGTKLLQGVINFGNEIRATYINIVIFDDVVKMFRKYKFTEFINGQNSVTMIRYNKSN